MWFYGNYIKIVEKRHDNWTFQWNFIFVLKFTNITMTIECHHSASEVSTCFIEHNVLVKDSNTFSNRYNYSDFYLQMHSSNARNISVERIFFRFPSKISFGQWINVPRSFKTPKRLRSIDRSCVFLCSLTRRTGKIMFCERSNCFQ